ncbi:hypothetical protein MCERHM31_00796 [Methylophilaceae bacterium]
MPENLDQFDNLEAEAQRIDAETNAQNQQQPEPPTSINAAFAPVIASGIASVVMFADKLLPFTSKIFDQSAIEAIAASVVKVADVEQVDLKNLIGDPDSRIGAWVQLGFAVGLPSFTLYMAAVEYNKSKPAAEKEVKGEVVPADAGASHEDLKQGFHA